MSLLEIILVALCLSLDAAAVAVTVGTVKGANARIAVTLGLWFGLSQAVMPLVGWLAGYGFRDVAASYGSAVGFLLLILVGGKMVHGAYAGKDEDPEPKDVLGSRTLLALALATSIDALIVGITFNFVPVSVPLAVSIIGGVTFLMAAAGVYLGARSKDALGSHAEALGGAILILLAFKTLLF